MLFFCDEIRKMHQSFKDFYQFRSLASAHQYSKLYKLFNKYNTANKKILDWGCGNGHFSYYLCTKGYQVWSYSFENSLLIWESSIKGKCHFIQGNHDEPVKLPFTDCFFDTVVSIGVLEHVRETQGNELKSLKEINKILKPDGLFICYHLPNYYSLIELFTRSFLPKKFHHQYRFTKKQIIKMCIETGFEILEIKQYGFLPRNFWNKAPKILQQSLLITIIWNALDSILYTLLSPICQNYYFIARKQQEHTKN